MPSRVLHLCLFAAAGLLAGCSTPDFSNVPDPTDVYRASLARTHGRADLPVLDDNSTLSDYLTYAALNNPGLEAQWHQWQAAVERIPQVTAYPEPLVSYRLYVLAMNMRHSIGIQQMIPGANKLRLKGDIAFEASESEREKLETARVNLVNAVKKSYFEYYYLSRAISVTRDTRELAKYLQDVATARYRVAMSPLSDIVKGQVELGKLDDSLRSVEALRAPVAARLNASLNRPASAPLPFPPAIALENITLSDDDVLARIAESNPELRAIDHEIAAQKAAQEAARAEYNPDWMVGIEYMNPTSSGKDQLALMLGVTLPIRTEKYKAMYREALLRERAAQVSRQDRLNALSADATMAIYEMRDAQRKISLYRDTLIPTAKESLKTTETAYSAGKATFLDLLDAERLLLEFMLSQERALANHAQKLAELEMIVGADLPRADAAPAKPETHTPEGRAPEAPTTAPETPVEDKPAQENQTPATAPADPDDSGRGPPR